MKHLTLFLMAVAMVHTGPSFAAGSLGLAACLTPTTELKLNLPVVNPILSQLIDRDSEDECSSTYDGAKMLEEIRTGKYYYDGYGSNQEVSVANLNEMVTQLKVQIENITKFAVSLKATLSGIDSGKVVAFAGAGTANAMYMVVLTNGDAAKAVPRTTIAIYLSDYEDSLKFLQTSLKSSVAALADAIKAEKVKTQADAETKIAKISPVVTEFEDDHGSPASVPTLTLFEQRLLQNYIGSGYDIMNSALRAGGKRAECIAPLAEATALVLKRFPKYEGIVWRGMRIYDKTVQRQQFMEEYKPGNTVKTQAFTSTSSDSVMARSFAGIYLNGSSQEAGVVLQIRSRSCRDITSQNGNEKEILCLPGTEFKVLSMPEDGRFILMEVKAAKVPKGTLEEYRAPSRDAAAAKPPGGTP